MIRRIFPGVELDAIAEVVGALNAAGVRYVVVGGIAVIAHGYARLTKNIDLVISLVPENVRAAIAVLTGLGYRPQIPEPFERFADPAAREAWHRDRGMVALHLWHPADPKRHVDLFTHEPFDVESELRAARRDEIAPGVVMPSASLLTLRTMKLASGRPQDLTDARMLEILAGLDAAGDSPTER